MTKQNITDLIKNTRGFTLIETMIALMVLTIGILAMMTMQTSAITGNYKASTMTIASSIASNQIEQLRSLPFTSLTAGTNTDASTGYPVAVTLASITGIAPNEAQLITVTVTRPNGMQPITYSYTKFRDL